MKDRNDWTKQLEKRLMNELEKDARWYAEREQCGGADEEVLTLIKKKLDVLESLKILDCEN